VRDDALNTLGCLSCRLCWSTGLEKTVKKDGALQLKTQNPGFYKCWQLKTVIPGPVLKISCWDHDDLSGDDVIGETFIDLENRYAVALPSARLAALWRIDALPRLCYSPPALKLCVLIRSVFSLFCPAWKAMDPKPLEVSLSAW